VTTPHAVSDVAASTAELRAEVVEILAGAVFRLLLEGRLPPPRDDKQAPGERR
jgi:hypothetical protein